LPKLWATRKVGYLLEQIRLNGELPELRTEVIRLAKKFGLVTPYTSYLAVDDSEFEQPRRGDVDRPGPGLADGDLGGMAEIDEDMDDRRRSREEAQRAPMAEPSDESVVTSESRRRRWRRGRKFGKRKDAPAPRADNKPEPKRPTKPKARPAKKGKAKSELSGRMAEGKSGSRDKADAFKSFDSETGEGSVAASEATREYKESDRLGDETGVSRRYVGGRTFVYANGVWTQDGVATKGKKVIEVEAYSTKYFELMRKHRELRKVVGLGETIVFELDGRIYKIVPSKK